VFDATTIGSTQDDGNSRRASGTLELATEQAQLRA
jgi:hypothetical protein